MSLLTLAAAYDSDSDSNNTKENGEMEREVVKGDNHDQVLGREMKEETGVGEELVNVLVPKEEPKDEYGELEQIPGSSFGAVSIKREPKEEYSEFGREAGGVCKNEPKLEERKVLIPDASYFPGVIHGLFANHP